MELKIKSIELTNFKGIQHKKIDFNGDSVKILGQNGAGKSTLADSVYWTFANCNSMLINNPPINPVGAAESISKVEIELSIDGKPCTVTKYQKYKEKTDEDAGKTTSAITNSFSINGVEKTATSFKADLVERGIDMDNFLMLSHPFAFTADTSKKGREEMRKVLFEMVDGISDLDIAKELKSADIIALLEQGYKLEEIEQMNKSSLKAINGRVGANNELIDARISGIIQSKSQINVEETKQKKTEYETELEQVRKDFMNIRNKDSDTETKIAELEGKCDEVERTETRKLEESNATLSEKLRKAEEKCRDLNYEMSAEKNAADRILQDIYGVKESLDHYREIYKKTQDEVFDKDSTVCPTCGRSFPKTEIEDMKKRFEESKTKRLADYKKMGETFSNQHEALKKEYDDKMAEYDKKHKDWLKADDKVSKLTEQLRNAPRRPDMAQNKEYQSIRKEIEELRAGLGQTDAFRIQELSNRESYLIQMIKQADAELILFERNKELDQQIAELREEKRQAEIERAKHEKIIDAVEEFKKFKNSKLSAEINKHFKIAQFRLFKTLRNGSTEDDCAILVDGKELNSQLNQSKQVLALCDVIAGLQKFKNQYLPVFLDNHALFTSETDKILPLECQTIKLIASNGFKEITVDKG